MIFRNCKKNRHKFEARYDLSAPSNLGDYTASRISEEGFIAFINAHRTKTYIHDICVICGKVVERTEGK